MKDEVSHQPYSAFAVCEQCVSWDCSCSAAVLNPTDSPFEQKREQFEDAGYCCSPGNVHAKTSDFYICLNTICNLQTHGCCNRLKQILDACILRLTLVTCHVEYGAPVT